jgi:hypothetical protein
MQVENHPFQHLEQRRVTITEHGKFNLTSGYAEMGFFRSLDYCIRGSDALVNPKSVPPIDRSITRIAPYRRQKFTYDTLMEESISKSYLSLR